MSSIRVRQSWFHAALSCLATLGCQSTDSRTKAPEPLRISHSMPNDLPDPAYDVGVGDEILIQTAAGSIRRAKVEQDGTIVADGQSIRVDGLGVAEVAEVLAKRGGPDYRGCRVSVDRFNSQFIFVYDDSSRRAAQAVPYRGRESLTELLRRIDCQTCKTGHRVRVVRPSPDLGSPPRIMAAQFDAQLRDRDPAAPAIFIQPNDYVYLAPDRGKAGSLTSATEATTYRRPREWVRQARLNVSGKDSLGR